MNQRDREGWTVPSEEDSSEPKITIALDRDVPPEIDALVMRVSGSVPAFVSVDGARAPKVGKVFVSASWRDDVLTLQPRDVRTDAPQGTATHLRVRELTRQSVFDALVKIAKQNAR